MAQVIDPNELPQGKPIGILELVKLPEHVIRGTWKRHEDSIACEASENAHFMVPVAIRGSYELDCEFTRRTNDEAIIFVFPAGLTSSCLILSGWHGGASGIDCLAGRETKDLPASTGAVIRPGKLANGRRYHLHLEVTQTGTGASISASLDDKRFVVWKGPIAQLGIWHHYTVPCPQAIGVQVHQSVADIHKMELTVKKGSKAYRLGDDFKNPATVVADTPPKSIAAKCLTWKDRKYLITDKPVNYAVAQQMAAQLQGRLLTISSAEEDAFIRKEGRGVQLYMSGWRHFGSNVWRDERNRPLRFFGSWAGGNPALSYWETVLGIHTTGSAARGWGDYAPWDQLHACIEWGEEYPEAK